VLKTVKPAVCQLQSVSKSMRVPLESGPPNSHCGTPLTDRKHSCANYASKGLWDNNFVTHTTEDPERSTPDSTSGPTRGRLRQAQNVEESTSSGSPKISMQIKRPLGDPGEQRMLTTVTPDPVSPAW